MKLAIMQPYFFPYLGYFQLIRAVDLFVFYDDVTFIKGGWINRNRILVNGSPVYFTVPLTKASSFVPINKTLIHHHLYPRWKKKFLRTLNCHYGSTPHFARVFDLIQEIIEWEPQDIATLAIRSVERCSDYLGIHTDFGISSRDFPQTEARGVRKVLDMCHMSKADVYVNAPGGKELYDQAEFEQEGIGLAFLNPQLHPYSQASESFVPGLSILDVLMRCGLDRSRSMLEQYVLE